MAFEVPFPMRAGVVELKTMSLDTELDFRVREVGACDQFSGMHYLELPHGLWQRGVSEHLCHKGLEVACGRHYQASFLEQSNQD